VAHHCDALAMCVQHVAHKVMKKKQRRMTSEGRQGESDRFIGTKMPPHLFKGKRGIGKTDSR
jgi:nucleolar GTP-binding protein